MFVLAILARFAYRRIEDDYNPTIGQCEEGNMSYGATENVPTTTLDGTTTETQNVMVLQPESYQSVCDIDSSSTMPQSSQSAELGFDNYTMMEVNDVKDVNINIST